MFAKHFPDISEVCEVCAIVKLSWRLHKNASKGLDQEELDCRLATSIIKQRRDNLKQKFTQQNEASEGSSAATRPNVSEEHSPPVQMLALGSGEMTPLELAVGYSVFANGGFQSFCYGKLRR